MSIIAAKSDQSTLVRVLEPIRIFMDMLVRGDYFGLPPELLTRRMSQSVLTIFDNWILNQFMYYGLLGLAPIVLLIFMFGRVLGLIILSFGVTNGDLFYYDRFIFLIILVVSYSSFKNRLSVNNNAFSK